MTDDVLAGKWKQMKGKIKSTWGDLTDDELMQAEGSSEELAGILQTKYGYSKDRAKMEIDKFLTGEDRPR
jgi:uncharacterized protein YjbJ (UPF0337 family)